jgi:DNA (cytosine-5)-methyltransferase 1
MFETPDEEQYFTAQWFYRAENTVKIEFQLFRVLFWFALLFMVIVDFGDLNVCVQVIKDHGNLVDKKRIFISDVKDENPLDCLVRKVNIVQISPDVSASCSSFVV